MLKRTILLVLTTAFLFGSACFSQEVRRHSSGPRRQLATIIFSGLGGALLGLSTLSFYGRPQDKLSNIALGFAAGVIAGTVYVTYRSATSHDYYDGNQDQKALVKPLNPPLVGRLELPDLPNEIFKDATASTENVKESALDSLLFAPLIQKDLLDSNLNLGGQVTLHF